MRNILLNILFEKDYIIVEKFQDNKTYIMALKEWVAIPISERQKYIYIQATQEKKKLFIFPYIQDIYYSKEQDLKDGGYLK